MESTAQEVNKEIKPEVLRVNKEDGIKTEFIKIEVEEDMKTEAYKVLKKIGLTPTEAINSLFTELVRWRKMPFKPKEKIPNAETLAAFEESKDPEKLETYKNFQELLDKLKI